MSFVDALGKSKRAQQYKINQLNPEDHTPSINSSIDGSTIDGEDVVIIEKEGCTL